MTHEILSVRRKPALHALLAATGAALLAASAAAQVDLSGSWAPRNYSNILENGPGGLEPGPVDYAGIPLNANGLAGALMTNDLQLSEPERICSFYPPSYLFFGPFGVKIWDTTEPRNGTTVAWNISGWEDRAPNTIWMDGRAPPSRFAAHEMAGFATGVWRDDVLVASFTHMRAGIARRNLAPLTDRATMTVFLFPHGDELTVTGRIVDPYHLSQPYILTRTFERMDGQPLPTVGQPCTQTDEGVAEGQVVFFPPGQNPNLNYMTQHYGIPLQATLGGAQTLYPQYRRYLKRTYVRPARCFAQQPGQCGGPGRQR
jgi:hypothetical protein